jgi:hypothetical protein
MRAPLPEKVERGRITSGYYGSKPGDRFGCFWVHYRRALLCIIASDGQGISDWEHVSVSLKDRWPTWDEMCFVRRSFFGPKELVVQYHALEDENVSISEYCLHLWSCRGAMIPRPPQHRS